MIKGTFISLINSNSNFKPGKPMPDISDGYPAISIVSAVNSLSINALNSLK